MFSAESFYVTILFCFSNNILFTNSSQFTLFPYKIHLVELHYMCCIHMTGCETIFSMLLLEKCSSISVMGIISPWVKLLMCLCAVYMYVSLCVHVHVLCVCICSYVCLCLCLFIWLYVLVSVHMFVSVCVSVHIFVSVCLCICLYLSVCL